MVFLSSGISTSKLWAVNLFMGKCQNLFKNKYIIPLSYYNVLQWSNVFFQTIFLYNSPTNARNPKDIREVVLRMTGHHDDPEALKALSIELVSVSTNFKKKILISCLTFPP